MMTSAVAVGNRRKSLTLKGVDPETCMIVFKNHWAQVVKILEKHEPGRGGISALSFLTGHSGSSSGGSAAARLGPIPADEASAVQNYVEHMLFLLMEEEAGQGGAMGPILEFVVLEGVMERLFLWSLRRQFTEDMKLEQLRMYQMLLAQARQPLLHHKPVLKPLMMLLASCSGAGQEADSAGVVEAELVLLLNQLCAALVKDPSVLELFFHTSEDQGAANFLLFSLLIPYTHRQGSVGQQAREALLLIMSLSASEPRVAQHIADNTYFCPVLATGLSGLYSSLPARLQVYSEDWHSLDEPDWQQVPALVHFLHSLNFCSAVASVAHPSIRSQLLSYIYNGFLVPVLAPALHKLTVEEVMTTTAYLDLFLRSISEPALLQTFLSFILLHTHDNVHILDTLVSRVNTPFQLGTVSLALFKTLIGLFCEDVMLQLVFRYLIPCQHLSWKQHSSLKNKDCYSSIAASFLLLMPSWCPGHLPNSGTGSELIHWPKASDPLTSESVGYCRGSDFLMDANYLHYLRDARRAISTSQRACCHWSAPYDGSDPRPEEYRPETPGDDFYGMELRDKRNSICSSTTPSSLDALSVGPQGGRTSSALELEWDDLFPEDDPFSSGHLNQTLANWNMRMTNTVAPVPPQHIQEMRRTATKLVHGSYVEECEFQDDVRVYDLVAQKDSKSALLERIMAANRRARAYTPHGQRVSAAMAATTITAALTTMEKVNGMVATRSEDSGNEVRQHFRRIEDEEDGRHKSENLSVMSQLIYTNGFNIKSDIMEDLDVFNEEETTSVTLNCRDFVAVDQMNSINQKHKNKPRLQNGQVEEDDNSFLTQYYKLMLSLGVEPDVDEAIFDMDTFRNRVQELRHRLEEESGQSSDLVVSTWWVEDKEEEVLGEERRTEDAGESGSRQKHGVPFTGPFISVLLSRLENLLENSIAVNLLVTGILAQLASYPQPLLRSFLLSTETHGQSSTRTLYQVLVTVHAQIERYVQAVPDYSALLTQAWRFLLAKDEDSKVKEILHTLGDDAVNDTPLLNGSMKIACPPSSLGVLPPCPTIPPQNKSRVFAIILYAEFLKELAALAQEHSVASDGAAEE
ncbi:FHF complex subunit HOOK interacting protein 1A-like [Synchiropus splendidus]|uniref:FHF complex subunit HOOK interacting protein 1A-like n=1 Tax=Synchiropus splendidus TaxID=270530 RepID=UPI00237DDDCA|nr:FHF complex subunit HOOK interacting protein 1A-like [Synchiropus splendidus]